MLASHHHHFVFHGLVWLQIQRPDAQVLINTLARGGVYVRVCIASGVVSSTRTVLRKAEGASLLGHEGLSLVATSP